jgi:Flp pilus assembly protein TadG
MVIRPQPDAYAMPVSPKPAAPHAAARRRRVRGNALLELALVMPLLCLLLLGVLDIGRAFTTQVAVVGAAREGARAGVYLDDDNAVRDIVVQDLNGLISINPAIDILITRDTVNQTVRVTINYQHQILFGLINHLGNGGWLAVNAHATMPMTERLAGGGPTRTPPPTGTPAATETPTPTWTPTRTVTPTATPTCQASGPAALWAGSQTNNLTLEISGSTNRVEGVTHSNRKLQTSGSTNTFTGRVQYVTSLQNSGGGNVFQAGTHKVGVTGPPVSFAIADYAPGGSRAVAAGPQYRSRTGPYTLTPADIALGGLWYINGDAFVSAQHVASPPQGITIVASGRLDISGSDSATLAPFVDGLLLFANRSDNSSSAVLKVAGSSHSWHGHIYAPRGLLELSGSNSTFRGAVVADRVRVGGSSLRIIYGGVPCP